MVTPQQRRAQLLLRASSADFPVANDGGKQLDAYLKFS